MRKCCCCISVNVGAFLLGLVGVVACVVELIAIVPYLMGVEEFNPIDENMNNVWYIMDKFLQQRQNFTQEETKEIVETAQEWLWTAMLAEGICAAVYIGLCLFMIIGVMCKVRCLMVPYLIVQMIVAVVFALVGLATTVVLFMYFNYIMGLVGLLVFVVATFLFLYFWMAVQQSFVELGPNRDYMCSPAPVKPIYNPGGQKYHPSAPQHFNME